MAKARRTMATAYAEGFAAGIAAANDALEAAFIARMAELPLADMDPADAEDLVMPGLEDLAHNLDALATIPTEAPR